MKLKKRLLLAIIFVGGFVSCSDDDRDTAVVASECQFPFSVPKVDIPNNVDQPIDQTYDYQKMKCITKYSYSLSEFPKGPISEPEEYTPLTSEEIKQEGLTEVEDMFYDLQKYFFKEKKITIIFANDAEGFSADYSAKEILVGAQDVREILNDTSYKAPLDVVKFILAHEIAHYVHEIATNSPITEKVGYTLNGNISIYTLEELLGLKNPTTEESVIINNYEPYYLYSHSEIDVFAALVLIENDFNGWDDFYTFLDKLVEENEIEGSTVALLDFEGRRNAIKKTVASVAK